MSTDRRRRMARPVEQPPNLARRALAIGGFAIAVGIFGVLGLLLNPAHGTPAESPSLTGPNLSVFVGVGGSRVMTAEPTAEASSTRIRATRSALPAASTPIPAPTQTRAPAPIPAASSAPNDAQEFDLEGQVIDIAFPLRADAEYHYRDNFLERRSGPPDPYNHARLESDGQLIRLHDGIDIYAPEGEPVLAPFDGTVIDPATRWSPWEPDRYGLTVVVESDEPGTAGYAAVLVHLDHDWVYVGQHVSRGQVLGVLGKTGNAENVRPQLHFELRAPFLLDWSALGEDREVDAFNPYPSLIAADPQR